MICGKLYVEGTNVRGHAYDASDLMRRIVVELLVDGWPVDVARADAFSPEASAIGDGCYGFGFRLSDVVIEDGGTIQARVANQGVFIGDAAQGEPSALSDDATGSVSWAGGLRLTGWVEPAKDMASPGVRLIVERKIVGECDARGFRSVVQGDVRRTMSGFDTRLPASFADGCVHQVTVLDRQGRHLRGSPCSVLAFADGPRDGLRASVGLRDDDPRAALIDRFLPESVPFSAFRAWDARFSDEPLTPVSQSGTVAVALVGDRIEPSLDSLEIQSNADWLAIQLPDAGGPGRFAARDLSDALTIEPRVDTVCIALAGTLFRPDALATFRAVVLNETAIAYSDAVIEAPGGPFPLLWPAFDLERQQAQGYTSLAFAAPVAAISAALRTDVSSIYDLFWAVLDRLSVVSGPVHIPATLVTLPPLARGLGEALAASLGRNGLMANAAAPDRDTGLPCVHVKRTATRAELAVVVVEPDAVRPDLEPLQRACDRWAIERLVVSHRAWDLPPEWRGVVAPESRNPSRLRNAALASTQARQVLLLDAGVAPLDDAAIGELLSCLADDVVAAGGVLLAEDGIILSAGMVLGPGFDIVPAFAGLPDGAPGYAGAVGVSRGVGALAASCLMVDRIAVEAVGAFDALLYPERYGAADLSLRLRGAGGRLVVTPRARFVARGTRKEATTAALAAERDHFRNRWGEALMDDPHYHPGLNRDASPFTALAWPPRSRAPRRSRAVSRLKQDLSQ